MRPDSNDLENINWFNFKIKNKISKNYKFKIVNF